MGKELKDTYFRRAFIPIILTLCVFATIFVVIATSASKTADWETSPFAMLGGAMRALRKAARE